MVIRISDNRIIISILNQSSGCTMVLHYLCDGGSASHREKMWTEGRCDLTETRTKFSLILSFGYQPVH
jgi:hypothetical protein